MKMLLSVYLKEEVEGKIDFDLNYNEEKVYSKSIFELFKPIKGKFRNTYFVSFNYTSKVLNQYYKWLKEIFEDSFPSEPIYIHGLLEGETDPLIFGYGDENSNDYKNMELELNNDLLKNFKTFQYLRSSKYTQILGLLNESDSLYVQVVGHSCGLCDKALLRAIFQNPNVHNLEIVYHDNESKYFENLYNASRLFDDNTIMREKLIPLEETNKI